MQTAVQISIHALRVEGDHCLFSGFFPPKISIHALRVEGDATAFEGCFDLAAEFLSTPSGWRATCILYAAGGLLQISIHALRVEGDAAAGSKAGVFFQISIHALRVEGDGGSFERFFDRSLFLSTPSGWRATSACHCA